MRGLMLVLAFTRSGPGVLEVDGLRPEWRLIDWARFPRAAIAALFDEGEMPVEPVTVPERRFKLRSWRIVDRWVVDLLGHPWKGWGGPVYGNGPGGLAYFDIPIYVEVTR